MKTNAMQSESVRVKILGRDYAFACAPEEKQSLLECVAMVDEQMNSIRNLGKLKAIDRIAVMAALTIANDLIAARRALASAPESKRIGVSSETTLEIESAGSRMQATNDAIARFLEQVRPQLEVEQKGMFS